MDQAGGTRDRPPGDRPAGGPRVFVSYAHDSETHKADVRTLADLLTAAGVQVTLDQHGTARRDWHEWMTTGIRGSDYVIVIASPEYRKVSEFTASTRERIGSPAEYRLLRTLLAENRDFWLPRILPAVLPGRSIDEIPLAFQPRECDHYLVPALTQAGLASLLAAIGPGPGGGPGPAAARAAAVPRLVAPSREALTSVRRLVIPAQRREALPRLVLPAVQAALAVPSVVALYADAGLGKSVLLGQVCDELAADETLGITLVSASDKVRDRPADVAELDRQLGGAALAGCPLTELTARQRTAGLRPVVLLDTLDLILDDHTLPLLGALLRGLADDAVPVVLTCRDFEFREYLEDADGQVPLLGSVLRPVRLPRLTEDEVKAFARAFLEAGSGQAARDPDRFIGELLHLRAQRRAVVEICGSPLLLRLVCELYGGAEVPEDLTVSRLYGTYWRKVVMGDPSRRVSQAQRGQRNQACLAAARHLLARSTSSFVEDFDPGKLAPPADPAAVDGLRSAGVLVGTTDPATVRFFHQTLAEYAIARYLAQEPAARLEFIAGLRRAGRGGHLWPVLIHLLFALTEPADYLDAVRSLDLTEQLAYRAVALSAVGRPDPAVLADLAGQAAGLPADHQLHLIEACGSAAEAGLEPACELLAGALSWLDDKVICTAAGVLGRLAGRLPGDRTAAVTAAVQAAVSRRRAMAGDDRGDELAGTLLGGLAESARPWSLAELGPLRDQYKHLGAVARAETALLHRGPDPARAAALLPVALGCAAPPSPPARAELASMIQRILGDTAAAEALGWDGWPGMLARPYPPGWDDVQIKAAAGLLGTLAGPGHEPLAALFALVLKDGGVLAGRALHVAEQLTAHQPSWMTGYLLTLPPPAAGRSAAVADTVLKRLPAVDQETATRLLDWLAPAIPSQPRALLQGAAVVAQGHPALAGRVLRDAIRLTSPADGQERAPLSGKDLDRVLKAVLRNCPASGLDALAPGLRAAASHPQTGKEVAARIAGMLAPLSARDRDRCAELALGPVGAHARGAVRTMVDVAIGRDWFDPGYAARLLDSATPGVVEEMANWISHQQREPGWRLPPGLFDALAAALYRASAAPVAHQLIAVLDADVRAGGPAAGQLPGLLDALLSRAGSPGIADSAQATDLRRTLSNGVLSLLQAVVGQPDDRVAAEAMLTRALTSLPLDSIDGSEERVSRLVWRAAQVPRSALLTELTGRLAELPGRVQLGVAMAVETLLTSRSAMFRELSSQASDPRVVAYVARKVGG